ncbi:MAG: class I SAM-dependent methyltransferase [bacterium]|nr:class I SAM-dependent methyltransferase [bacterium]
MRESIGSVLELGVKTGASLRMWREYLPNAEIHGVDLNPYCLRQRGERITIHCASQDDEDRLNEVALIAGGFDLIIDDCSHINELTLASHRILWPHLRGGGHYVIEDLGMSHRDYSEQPDQETFMDGELAMNMRRGVSPKQSREQLTNRFEAIIFEMDMRRGDVRFLHFWPNMAVAQKVAT